MPVIEEPEVGSGAGERGGLARRRRAQLAPWAGLLLLLGSDAIRSLAASPDAPAWAALARTTSITDVAISPDGNRVAWVERREGEAARLLVKAWRGSAAPAAVQPPGDRERGEHEPSWSPDSSTVAFVSDAGRKGQGQVWVASAAGRDARRLTEVKGYVARPSWSPDGSAIAFLTVPGGAGGGPLQPHAARTGVIEQAIDNQRVAVVDVKTGSVRLVSPADLHVFEFDWSPDGRAFAVTASPGPGDDNWWEARLYVVDRVSATAREVYRPPSQIADPRWSPDGNRIAFIGGLMSDEGATGGDLTIVPAEGGAAEDQTAGRRSSASWLRWVSPSRILFTEYVGGASAIAALDTGTRRVETLWNGPERVAGGGFFGGFAVAADGATSALVRQSFERPPEVWAGPTGGWVQLTRANASQRALWGQAESVEWSSDGFTVQGWLVPPPEVSKDRRYPLVVIVHGGPSGIVVPAFPGLQQPAGALAASGCFVLLPNPRGSFGQGEAFTMANVKDFGGGDPRDVLAGVDAVLTRFPVDPHRLGITGWSYGGFMTMWAVTQTDRFKAAVAGAGVANWQSYYGENLIDKWMIPFFGASVYADPAVYERCSPIRFVTRVRTPTLVLVGERDAECPAPQSFEFWHALKTLGVPTELVVYPGEGHRFRDPDHLKDRVVRTLAWFGRYLGP